MQNLKCIRKWLESYTEKEKSKKLEKKVNKTYSIGAF